MLEDAGLASGHGPFENASPHLTNKRAHLSRPQATCYLDLHRGLHFPLSEYNIMLLKPFPVISLAILTKTLH